MTICPTTAEDWIQAEQRKSCATGIYHCLRTQLNFPIEVCSPRITLIQAGGCPYWNIYGNVDRDDCRKYLQCPDKPFLSNKVYQYPFCYQSLSTTTTYSTTSEVPITTTTMLVSSTVSAERSEYEHLWLFVIMAILSCAVLAVLFVFIIRYHLHIRSRQKDPEIPVNGDELTNEQNSRTPLLDGRKEEEKYENEIAGIEIKEEPETPLNDGVLSEETSTQRPFLVEDDGKEIKEADQKILADGEELTSERYISLDQMILPDGGELTSERYILLGRQGEKKYKIVLKRTEIKEDPEIPVNNGELTNERSTQIPPLEPETPVNDEVLSEETSTQTPFLDGEKEEDKNKIATEDEEIKEEPETTVNEGVLREETSTQPRFLEPETSLNDGVLSEETSKQTPFFEPGTPLNDGVLNEESSTQTPFLVEIEEIEMKEYAEIPVYGGEPTTEPSTQTPVLEPVIQVNDGVPSKETSRQTPFLDGQKEEENNEKRRRNFTNILSFSRLTTVVKAKISLARSVFLTDEDRKAKISLARSVFLTDEDRKEQKWNDATSFFFTDAYKSGIDTLKDEDILVIKGSSGSGKTSMAREIMCQYDKQDWSCVWIDNAKNFDKDNISRNTIFVMDNCFGTWNINQNDCVYERVKEVLCSILDKINQDHICKMVLIMTKEESLWYWNSLCKKCPKLGRSKVIDMDCEQSFLKKKTWSSISLQSLQEMDAKETQ